MKALHSPDARCSVYVDEGPKFSSVRLEIAQGFHLQFSQRGQLWNVLAELTGCPVSQLNNAQVSGPYCQQDGDQSIRVGLLPPDLADAVGAAWLAIGSEALKDWTGQPVMPQWAPGYEPRP